MNILLWILQGMLAIHTAIGAFWKFSNSEEAVDSLKALPHGVWMGLSVIEIICSICLVAPVFNKKLGFLAPYAAIVIALEMLLFIVVHLSSGEKNSAEIIYWALVAAFCAFIAYGRLRLKPIQ